MMCFRKMKTMRYLLWQTKRDWFKLGGKKMKKQDNITHFNLPCFCFLGDFSMMSGLGGE